MQRLVRDLINQRNLNSVPRIESGTSVEGALIKLDYFESGALLVMRSERVVGVFTERDFVRATIRNGLGEGLSKKVDDAMTVNVAFVTEDYRLEECMAMMSKMRVSHLPVLKNGSPKALISMRHIMEALVEDKDFIIDELTKYVTGSNTVRPRL